MTSCHYYMLLFFYFCYCNWLSKSVWSKKYRLFSNVLKLKLDINKKGMYFHEFFRLILLANSILISRNFFSKGGRFGIIICCCFCTSPIIAIDQTCEWRSIDPLLLSTKKLDRYKIFSTEEWTTDLSEEIYLIGNNIILPKNGESFKFILLTYLVFML